VGDAIGQILQLAVGVALSPLPIIAAILILVSPRGRTNGPAYVVGCLVGLAVVGAVVLLLAGPANASDGGEPATWVDLVKLALGALLLLLALQQWRGRPREGDGDEVSTPKWMDAIESFTPTRAAGTGAVLAGANPKNLLLAVGAAATIAQTGIPGGEQAIAYAVFMLIGIAGVATPVAISFAMGDRAGPMLDSLKRWMTAYGAVIMAVLCLVIGAKLVGDAIAGLA
jgi:threonine/homoserine/homoserine lactone efflux protein